MVSKIFDSVYRVRNSCLASRVWFESPCIIIFGGRIQKLTWDPVKIRPPWQSKQVRGWGCALTEFNHSSFKSSSEEYFTKFSQPLSETPLLDLTWSENNNFFLSKFCPLMMGLWTQCGNFWIFLSLRFYVKSILENV